MIRKAYPRLPNPSRREFLQSSSLALIGLAGGGFPGISRAGRGQVLHIRNYMDVSSLDPVSTVSTAEGVICGAIYQNLLRFRPGSSWVP
jgi:MarR-like DNA-binding transcriptional regulator SgrR of sgrS sRNA